MSASDWTTLAVALVGVGGTLCATLLTQRAHGAEVAEQNRRAERERAEDQRRRDTEREAEQRERALQMKREIYAALNAAARAYRVAARDAVLALERGESVDSARLDGARDEWNDQYAQAQMVIPKLVLDIASELNAALGLGYRIVKDLPGSPDPEVAYDRAKNWFDDSLSDGVYLLRLAFRHDLGVQIVDEGLKGLRGKLAELDAAYSRVSGELSREHGSAWSSLPVQVNGPTTVEETERAGS
ncbi:hypothetical protein E6W39_05090 [Kitasatospora acidiphila]|uniref:Uncharacterized protein n=1 Tax=Kitasatospora acidiphila TaxID=2567942 RepID=A0A540VY92_9ACTN|nr:hypothetical protein [Kitasatospora acidiphila]TQF01738.1 hypothetical protein E6W39_05090 [Kitasatospora acidiphila]